MVYDSKNPNKLSENDNLRPTNPYSNTRKLVVEKMLKDIHQGSRKLSVANQRCSILLGHILQVLSVKFSWKYYKFVPNLVGGGIKENKKLKIYGDDWSNL